MLTSGGAQQCTRRRVGGVFEGVTVVTCDLCECFFAFLADSVPVRTHIEEYEDSSILYVIVVY